MIAKLIKSKSWRGRTTLKKIGLQLCTCTWIEIMTGAGLTLYLSLALHSYALAALTAGLFIPLI